MKTIQIKIPTRWGDHYIFKLGRNRGESCWIYQCYVSRSFQPLYPTLDAPDVKTRFADIAAAIPFFLSDLDYFRWDDANPNSMCDAD